MLNMVLATLPLLLSPPPDAVDSALALAGLTKETARLDANVLRFFDFDEFVLGSFTAYFEDPWRIPTFSDAVRDRIKTGLDKPSNLVQSVGWLTGLSTRRTLLGDPTADLSKHVDAHPDLSSALATLGVNAKGSPSAVPAEVVKAAALVLRAEAPVLAARKVSFEHVGGVDAAWKELTKPGSEEFARVDEDLQFARKADARYVISAGTDLVIACEKAAAMLKSVGPARFHYELETPLGWVVLNGAADDTYPAKPYLLIIDTGGNDTYFGGACTTSGANGVSVLIDLAGNDRYLSAPALATTPIEKYPGRKEHAEVPSIGGAVAGVSVLIDAGGNDLYRTVGRSQGSAVYGLSVLWDMSGDDHYDCYSLSQGYGMFGIGVLLDGGGADRYDCFTGSQGCGNTFGLGLLVDVKGNDKYRANDTVIDDPSAQSKDHATSMAQGAGCGRRADYSDCHSLGGGFGILCDCEGDDEYSCGTFGQGVGYWKGVGMLLDLAGNDRYNGVWYVQGACAHFAIGILHDYDGNDSYTATINMAQGAGHDFSIGFLIDDAGNDVYHAPNLSLGASNAAGIGVFIDRAGDDTYVSSGCTLGKANPVKPSIERSLSCGLGLFLDLGGNDSYPNGCPWAKNGASVVNWTEQAARAFESTVGIFVDLR